VPVVFAIISAIAFFFAIVFHAVHVSVPVWLDWQGLALIGLFFLALAATGVWRRIPAP
jgi:hypothetical protein